MNKRMKLTAVVILFLLLAGSILLYPTTARAEEEPETINGIPVIKKSDEEVAQILRRVQWKELPVNTQAGNLIHGFAATDNKCAIACDNRIFIYAKQQCVACYQYVTAGEYRLFSYADEFYLYDVRGKSFKRFNENEGVVAIYQIKDISASNEQLLWLGSLLAKPKLISKGNYTITNRNPAVGPFILAEYDTLLWTGNNEEVVLYTSMERQIGITVFLIVFSIATVAGIIVIVYFARRKKLSQGRLS